MRVLLNKPRMNKSLISFEVNTRQPLEVICQSKTKRPELVCKWKISTEWVAGGTKRWTIRYDMNRQVSFTIYLATQTISLPFPECGSIEWPSSWSSWCAIFTKPILHSSENEILHAHCQHSRVYQHDPQPANIFLPAGDISWQATKVQNLLFRQFAHIAACPVQLYKLLSSLDISSFLFLPASFGQQA